MTAEQLRHLISYDPSTGVCRWLPREETTCYLKTWNRRFAGHVVGNPDKDGYFQVGISGTYYRIHRLVWLYVYGEWPSEHLDHINGDPSDNRIKNIRKATPKQNSWNRVREKLSASGRVGVFLTRNGKRYRARPWVDGRLVNAGTYDTIDEASAAYDSAIAYRGEFIPKAA
jgi:hypothetical protein